MEDQNNYNHPPTFDVQKLIQRISELRYSPDHEFYALSLDFLDHSQRYINAVISDPQININLDLFQGNTPFSGKLKQSLRYAMHYTIIDGDMLAEIQSNFNCSAIRVSKCERLSQRWMIYQEVVSYFFISKKNYEKDDQGSQIDIKKKCFFTYNNMEDIRMAILKQEGFPEYCKCSMWILIGQCPKRYAQLKQKLKDFNTLIPVSMLINDPEIFKLKRRFKAFSVIIEPQDQAVIPSFEAMCYRHGSTRAFYTCICLHERSYACDSNCFNQDSKHSKRCIYVPKRDLTQNGSMKSINSLQICDQGLYNERNMCFFNTIIQSLAHIRQLSQYFLGSKELEDLNCWNCEGTFGQIALQYGHFIRSLSIDKNYKCHMQLFSTIGRWNPPYASKNQQDSHQFLIKMLDWLKQDLNLNEVKPKYKHIDSDNKNQADLALESIQIHKARNQSIIERLMQGIQKSVIKCITCGFASSTFDFFLTIQLPMAKQKKMEISVQTIFVYYISLQNQQKIRKIKVSYGKQQTLSGLKKQVKLNITRSIDYQLDFYKVNQGDKAQIINNSNLYDILSTVSSDEVIYCIEKYKLGQTAQYVPVILVIQGEAKPLFCRPLYLTKTIESRIFYFKILQYTWICRGQNVNGESIQSFFNKNLKGENFPFQLILKNQKIGQMPINREEQYKKITIQPSSILLMKIRKETNFKYSILNTYKSLIRQDDKDDKRKIVLVQPNIQDCFQLYCKKESIEDGAWVCGQCKVPRQASKKLYFQELPKILILSINRFKQTYSLTTPQFIKNESLIEFGQELDLGKFTQNQQQKKHRYRLFAVANHIRLNEDFRDVKQMEGHYYAYIRGEKGWLKFDDEQVTSVCLQKVMNNKNAYLLFYQRINQ